jgi:hypothetical protein
MMKFDLYSSRVVTMWKLEDWVVDAVLILFGGYSWISKKRPVVTQIPLLWLDMFDEVASGVRRYLLAFYV